MEHQKKTCKDCITFGPCSKKGDYLHYYECTCSNFVDKNLYLRLKNNYKVGDICIYKFDNENESFSIVEIVKILDDMRGVAEIKFIKVIKDDTGNGFFNYLYETGRTMNASFKYLKNIMEEG